MKKKEQVSISQRGEKDEFFTPHTVEYNELKQDMKIATSLFDRNKVELHTLVDISHSLNDIGAIFIPI